MILSFNTLEINLFVALLSFLAGSIPFGYLISKAYGKDIRQYGSGNIGATNVYRIIGKKAGAVTLLLDLLKGLIVVISVSLILKNNNLALYISSLFVVFGHDFSIFLKFKGGKGVATSYGAVLGLSVYPSIIGMIIWIVILLKTKYSSLAALLSFLVATILSFILSNGDDVPYIFLILYIIMLIKHKDNIKRIILKEEKGVEI